MELLEDLAFAHRPWDLSAEIRSTGSTPVHTVTMITMDAHGEGRFLPILWDSDSGRGVKLTVK